MKTSQKGFTIIELVLVVVGIGLVSGIGWYVWQSNKKSSSDNTSRTAQPQQETTTSKSEVTPTETAQDAHTYQSKLFTESGTYQSSLFPSLSFTVPGGWQVNEPTKYDESTYGAGSADAEITITKGNATLGLQFTTLRATGFEGYTCYNYQDVVRLGDIYQNNTTMISKKNLYRFTNKDGLTSYRSGVSKNDDDWTDASTGEFSRSEDANPNYCVGYPFIATHASTLNKKDYPDSVFNGVLTEVQEVLAWVLADVSGERSDEVLKDTDTIITSFSDSINW
jgi:type II secretory pathway pseudopilin PulG